MSGVAVKEIDSRTFGLAPILGSKELIVRAALFVSTASYLSIFLHYTAADPDEGIVLQGAQRILQGQIPYRDFFSFYTPLSYYWFAAVLRVFGSRIEVARASLVFFGAVFAAFTYVIARRVCSLRWAVAVGALVGVTTLPYRFLVLHNWDSTFWACLAVYAGLRFFEKSSATWAFAAGTLLVLTGLSEQSKGAGLGAGLILAVFLTRWVTRGEFRISTAHLAFFLAGLIWPFAVVFAYFSSTGSTAAMLSGWLWPLSHYSTANHVPYGYQNWSDKTRHLLFGTGTWLGRTIKVMAVSPCFLVPVLPVIALLLLGYWLWRGRQSSESSERSRYYVYMCSVLLGLVFSVVAVRPDIVHFMYLLPLFAVVLAWLLDGTDVPGVVFRCLRPKLAVFVVVSFMLMALSWPYVALQSRRNSIATRRGTVQALHEDGVIPYVQSHTAAGEHILVYPYLPLYYYLTGTFSPDGYEYLQPGMNTSQQAGAMLHDLEADPVRVVLFEPSFADKIASSWPGTAPAEIWRDPVGDYIVRHYRFCRVLHSSATWDFVFMVPRGTSCPAG